MAFTQTQRSQIRGYLGYDDVALGDFIESAIDRAETNSATETAVISLLDQISAVQTRLGSNTNTKAGVKTLGNGEVELFEGGTISDLKIIGRTLCNQLCIKLGVGIVRDYFSSGCAGGNSTALSAITLGGY